MTPDRHFDCTGDPERNEALLEVVDFVVHRSTPTELFQGLGKTLHKLFQFEVAGISLWDPARNALSLQVWHNGEVNPPIDLPPDTTSGWVLQNQQPLVFADGHPETCGFAYWSTLKDQRIRSFCEVPLTTPQRRMGTLAMCSRTAELYNDKQVQLLRWVADVVAQAVENTTTHAALQQQKGRLDVLLELSASMVDHGENAGLSLALMERLHQVVAFDFLSFSLHDPAGMRMRAHTWERGRLSPELSELPVDDAPRDWSGKHSGQ